MIDQMHPVFGIEEQNAINEYMKYGGWITEHEKTREFERMFAKFCDVKHAIAVNNGTISLALALLAGGIKAGDRVLIPALTMVATKNAVELIGAIPVFCDIGPDTLCMDFDKFNSFKNLNAVIYVSFNGRCGDIESLKMSCQYWKIPLIEDAAQSLGSKYNGKQIGTFGDIGSFSLSTQKIISTGQGGMLVTDNDDLAMKLRRLKDFGRDIAGSDDYKSFGINSKFTDLQAVIGIEQLKKLPDRIKRKKEILGRYDLSQCKDGELLWFCDVHLKDREEIIPKLNFGTRRMYPALADLSNAIKASKEILWLPSSIDLKDEEIDYICKELAGWIG